MGTSDRQRRLQLILWGSIAAVALVAAILIATSSGEAGGLRFIGQGSSPEDPESGLSTSAREIDQFRDEEGELVVADSVEAFTAEYGDPPNTDYARIRIPSLNVNAPVGRWIVDASIMPEPYGPTDVAFYDLSDWSGLGGFPGEGNNAIFGAHVDLNRTVAYADAHYRGPAVFWALDQATPGTIIEVDHAGETLRYAVVWVEEVEVGEGTNWRQYLTSDVPVDSITLFTCGGEFDFSTYSYSHRTFVRAERI